MEYTAEKVIQDFANLGHSDALVRQKANQDLLEFKTSPHAWAVSQNLLGTQGNQTVQFLGAQVFYLKVKGDFATLGENEREEVKRFIFNTIETGFDKYNPPTFRQLCASASVIAIRSIPVSWGNFIPEMIELANTSNQHLLGVLEILSNFHREFDDLQIHETQRSQIKEVLKNSSGQLCKFFEIILQNIDDPKILVKTLESACSLIEMGGFELLNYPDLVQVLMKAMPNDKLFKMVIEVLCEGLRCSEYSDAILKVGFEAAFASIKEEIKISVKKIIEFLATEVYGQYVQMKSSDKTLFCEGTTQLAAYVGVYFNIFIFENTDHSKVLLKFLLICTSHHDRMISHMTFEFWEIFCQLIQRQDVF